MMSHFMKIYAVCKFSFFSSLVIREFKTRHALMEIQTCNTIVPARNKGMRRLAMTTIANQANFSTR